MVVYEQSTKLKREFNSLHRFIKVVESEAYNIMLEEATRANEEVQMQVPLDTGRLQSGSGIYLASGAKKTQPKIVGYSHAEDPRSGYDYSDKQHDDTTLHHPYGRKANYIRDPFWDMVDRIEERFEEELGYAPWDY